MRVLAGDLGGTKTILCVAECDRNSVRIVRRQRFECAGFKNFSEILRAFVGHEIAADFDAVCIAVAGPVRARGSVQQVKITNLPWSLDSETLQRDFGFRQINLVNDFVAVGYGIEALPAEDFVLLQRGEPVERGTRAVIGAGTGLGQAFMVWQQEGSYRVVPTEGGRVEFGPADELQLDMTRYLMQKNDRTSYEMVLSGPGLVRIYEYLRHRGDHRESPMLAAAIERADPAAEIARGALEKNDPLANAALDMFVSIYGAQAGNLALTVGAVGGVYIAGGIAPQIISRLGDGRFVRAFTNKGKMSDYTSAIPIRVVMNADVGLIGAAHLAARMQMEPAIVDMS